MHKMLALAMLAILSSNVVASEGGINEETNLNGSNIQSMEYSDVVYAEQEFSISVVMVEKNANLSHINWITQVCINSGVCYPPKVNQMNSSDNQTWTSSIIIDQDATYLNWRIDKVDINETVVRVPEIGFGWKIWSDCWYDGNEWGGNDTSCIMEEENEDLPGFMSSITLSVIIIAALFKQRFE
tara:strand:+ start:722 stop:1273 length:552 start_codon:yes stop_codon:yes gene_type:complete